MSKPKTSPKIWFWIIVAIVLILPTSMLVLARSNSAGSATVTEGNITWQTDVAAAQLQAAKTDRQVLVVFTQPGCPPCEWMQKNAWPDDRVVKLVDEGFVPVMVDLSRRDSYRWAQQYGVEYTPTILVTKADGTVVTGAAGLFDPDQLYAYLYKVAPASAPAATDASTSSSS